MRWTTARGTRALRSSVAVVWRRSWKRMARGLGEGHSVKPQPALEQRRTSEDAECSTWPQRRHLWAHPSTSCARFKAARSNSARSTFCECIEPSGRGNTSSEGLSRIAWTR
ncbi:hypothetical protein BON30_08915 [Cystobacter ferrugineus]|uniref:Uncharacterized protein n=1 Tax=Cystobacter ferrugineus TaxID=83449 RepID=A0A1L9BFN5_9BACT|nr:hypothetical protein BON30_08915 [Cystobacter ferrugineus]